MFKLLENDFKTSITTTLHELKVNNLEMNGKMEAVHRETEKKRNLELKKIQYLKFKSHLMGSIVKMIKK